MGIFSKQYMWRIKGGHGALKMFLTHRFYFWYTVFYFLFSHVWVFLLPVIPTPSLFGFSSFTSFSLPPIWSYSSPCCLFSLCLTYLLAAMLYFPNCLCFSAFKSTSRLMFQTGRSSSWSQKVPEKVKYFKTSLSLVTSIYSAWWLQLAVTVQVASVGSEHHSNNGM